MRTTFLAATALAALHLAACSSQPDPSFTTERTGHSRLATDQGPLAVQRGPLIQRAERGESAPLSLMPIPKSQTAHFKRGALPVPKGTRRPWAGGQEWAAAAPTGTAMPTVISSWDGVGDGFVGPQGTYTVSVAPPDTAGDVGPNHYFSTVNLDFAIFNKTGALLYGPVPTNTLWNGFGGGQGLCASTNQGNVIVLYDPLADRWFISQFAFNVDASNNPIGPYYQCVAVSQTPDPINGGWWQYAFGPFQDSGGSDNFPDSPRFGVWPDAYYASWDMYDSSAVTFNGARFCAMDRSKMLAGDGSATQQCFQQATAISGVVPSDLDGTTPPPTGTPNLFITWDNTTASVLQYWKFQVDWANPANTTCARQPDLPVNTIVIPCSNTTGDCVPQSGTSTVLATIGMTYRLGYRNFGDHEAIVVIHTVNPGNGTTGLRWYELRNSAGQTFSSGPATVYQQGTYAPDNKWRWMGSIAQDQLGNLAVGYSLSSSSMHPAINYAGRLATDPLGQLPQGESLLFQGAGSQNGGLSRWGDYSDLTVDPTDDCTFFFTNEYLPANGSFNWRTRIGSFKFPNCPPPAVSRYVVSGLPGSIAAGAGTAFTVTAVDVNGATVTAYGGRAAITSSDSAATLPGNLTFVNGVAASGPITFRTTGTQSVTATDTMTPAITGTASIRVSAGATTTYVVTGLPAAVTAGVGTTFTVTATDTFGNTATGYSGTAAITSSDPAATLPGNASFSNGVAANIPITLKTVGNQSVTATDSVTPSLKATGNVTITAGTVTVYRLSALPSSVAAGAPTSFTITATDGFGNTNTSYAGPAAITSSDPQAVLPSPQSFIAGVAANVPVTFKTAGSQTVTATGTGSAAIKGTASTTVTSGTLTTFAVTGLAASIAAGSPTTFTVKAQDAFGNAVSSYAGTAAITSTDAQATLPSNPVFAAGVASNVPITFKTVGAQSVTATDTVTASLKGTASTKVTSGAPTVYTLSGLASSVAANVQTTFTVTARDGFGNTATSYSGTAAITSSDAAAILPGSQAFTAGVASNVRITFKTTGSQSVTAKDVVTPALTASATTTVIAGAPAAYVISGLPGQVMAGAATSLTVTAKDSSGNTVVGYAGSAAITSSDPRAVLPAHPTFVAGIASNVPITFRTTGTQSLTATDIQVASLTGSASAVVTPGAAVAYAISALAPSVVAGASISFTVTALDSNANVATGYTGLAALTSSDPAAVLPAHATFTAGVSSGVPITFKTTGVESVNATDTVTASITASASTQVAAGATAAYVLSGLAAGVTAGAPTTFKVTATDAFGNATAGYAGTAAITSSDPVAVLPGSQTFVAGIASAIPITFKTLGSQSLTAQDISNAALSVTGRTTVGSGAPTAYEITGLPMSVTAGQVTTFTITAKDANGNVVASYAGPAQLSSTDPQVVLAASVAFTAGVASGVPVTFKTAGSRSVTAKGSANALLTATASTTVKNALGKHYVLSGLASTVPSATAATFNVTATDDFGNIALDYVGTAAITSSDAAAVPPPHAAFTAGVVSAVSITLQTLGAQTVTATDSKSSAITVTGNTRVVAGRRKKYAISGLAASVQAVTPTTFTVTAQDDSGNVATDYTGSANITTSDLRATVPASATFVLGVATNVRITLATSGDQTVTATDSLDPTLTTDAVINVTPAPDADAGIGIRKANPGCGCGSHSAGIDLAGMLALLAAARGLAARRKNATTNARSMGGLNRPADPAG